MYAPLRRAAGAAVLVLLGATTGCGGTASCADICEKGNERSCGGDFDDPDCAQACEEAGEEYEAAGCGAEWDAYLECASDSLASSCDPKTACAEEADALFEVCLEDAPTD